MRGTHIQPHDVLLNITGASIGRVCSVPASFKDGNVNQHVCIIRPRMNQISSNYLSRYLSVPIVQQEILFEQNGASREGLTLDSIKNFWVLVPSFKEQQEILEFISEESEEINQAISHTHREIELMREYRDRLIADVVTGQVNVRGIEVPEIADEELLALEEDSTKSDDVIDADEDLKVEE